MEEIAQECFGLREWHDDNNADEVDLRILHAFAISDFSKIQHHF